MWVHHGIYFSYDYKNNSISFNEDGNLVCHYERDIKIDTNKKRNLSEQETQTYKNEIIKLFPTFGSLLKYSMEFENPKEEDNNVFQTFLDDGEGIKFPNKSEEISLLGLKTAKGIQFPKEVKKIHIPDLETTEGLYLPEKVERLSLGLKRDKGLKLPNIIYDLSLDSLESIEELKIPNGVKSISLCGLKTAKGLIFPEGFNGDIMLLGLETIEGLELPEEVDTLYLRATTIKGLRLPKKIGTLSITGLETARGLVLPKHMQNLWLPSLKNAEGIKFPEEIEEGIDLISLITGKGLVLPKRIGSYLELNSLKECVDDIEFHEQEAGFSINLDTLRNSLVPDRMLPYISDNNDD